MNPTLLSALALTFPFFLSSCGDGQKTALEQLQERGYEFTVDDYTMSAGRGDVESWQLFLAAGMAADVTDQSGRSALEVASEAGHGEVVRRLVDEGVDVNQLGVTGKVPLLLAAKSGSVDATSALLSGGADPKIQDELKWTPLAAASYEGHDEVVEVLAPASGLHVDRALHLASVAGHTKVIDVLLRNGASVFSRSQEGKTALMYAAANDKEDAVNLLLARGSNPYALDQSSQNAADLAAAEGYTAIAERLNAPPEALDPDPALAAENAFDVLEEAQKHDPMQAVDGVQDVAGVTVSAEGLDSLTVYADGEDSIGTRPAPEPLGSSAGSGIRVGAALPAGGIVSPRAQATVSRPVSVAATESPRQPRVPVRLQGRRVAAQPQAAAVQQAALKDSVQMLDYRESMLPVMLNDVQGDQAQVQMLFGDRRPITVSEGSQIPQTSLEVVSVERRVGYSKQGKGEPVNISRMVVEDTRTGQRHQVVRDVPAMSSNTYAVVRFAEDEGTFYDAREGDEFAAGNSNEVLRIVGVRPNQILIEKVASGEVITIPRTTYRGE